jgi:hypothetical protein
VAVLRCGDVDPPAKNSNQRPRLSGFFSQISYFLAKTVSPISSRHGFFWLDFTVHHQQIAFMTCAYVVGFILRKSLTGKTGSMQRKQKNHS